MSTPRSSSSPDSFHLHVPRTLRQWLMFFGVVAVVSGLAQVLIDMAKILVGESWEGFNLERTSISLIYTAIIMGSQLFSGEVLMRTLPLRSRFTTILHILIQASVGSFSFVLAKEVEHLIFGVCNIPTSKMIIVAAVSFFLSLIFNTIYYLAYFYRKMRDAEQSVLRAELKALRAQINPHFLFNTLNSIAALIRIAPDEAEKVTEQLADLFRYSLRASKYPLVTLEDELDSVSLYLGIETTRFRHRLEVDIEADASLMNAAMPSLMLQPLAENAVKHGVSVREGLCLIHIVAKREGQELVLEVRDTGPGFDLAQGDALFARGTGLANVRDRLLMAFPQQASMQLERNAVILRMPLTESTRQLHTPHRQQIYS